MDREIAPPEDYAATFGGFKPGQNVLEDLVARFHDRPIYVPGGIEAQRETEKRDRYHCVLLVDLGDTTYVLDNRYPHPMEHSFLPYEWHKLQIAGTQQWEWAQDADRSFA